jgi:HK97 gp10 family phage protein
MANSIELQGVDKLLETLRKRATKAVERTEKKALQAAGEVLAAEMRLRAPVSDLNYSHHLRDNIRVSSVRRKDGIKYVLVGPNKKVSWRAHFPEFGTSNMSATPYITPAFIAKKGIALQVLAAELRKGLDG